MKRYIAGFVLGVVVASAPYATGKHGPFGFPLGWDMERTVHAMHENLKEVRDILGRMERR